MEMYVAFCALLFPAIIRTYTLVPGQKYTKIINLGEEDFDGETLRFRDVVSKYDDGRIAIIREMVLESYSPAAVSSAFVVFPEERRWGTVGTMDLKVDHSRILNEYLQVLAAAPFCTGALDKDPSVKYRILSIGLGAGIVNSFFHERFPNINITVVELNPTMVNAAKKYFGLVEDARQRVILDDGINFVRSARGRGAKFDVIYVDACYNSFLTTGISCPVADFLKENNILMMKDELKTNGVLAVSVVCVDNKLQEVVQPFKRVFGKCTLLSYWEVTRTQVLLCGKNVPNESILKRLVSAQIKELGFDYSKILQQGGENEDYDDDDDGGEYDSEEGDSDTSGHAKWRKK